MRPFTIFAIQSAVNDGSGNAENGNFTNILNFPYGPGTASPFQCCGFECASQDLVNSFKTDANGLPFLDYSYNNADLKNDFGISSDQPYSRDSTTPIDPRLDWSVGRRGFPYLDWGYMPGDSWIRNQASDGPYCAKKFVYMSQDNQNQSGWAPDITAMNQPIIRFSDVLLMDAECAIELGDLTSSLKNINKVRVRASKSPVYLSTNGGTPTSDSLDANGKRILASNYVVKPYKSFSDQATARQALRFERRLEFAFEGSWFFDLVRWSFDKTGTNNGYAKNFITRYLALPNFNISYLRGAMFKDGNEYLPIPQAEITLYNTQGHPNTLQQNTGY